MTDGASPIRVLHVDSDADFLGRAAQRLEGQQDDLRVETATSATAGLDRLEGTDADCVVSGHDGATLDGLRFLRTVRERFGDVPFVLFTGAGDEGLASRAISAGVTDYVRKGGTDQFTVLANRIERAVSEHRARTELAARKRRYATLLANLPGMVYRCRNEEGWPMEFVSDGAESLTGYPADAIEEGRVVWGTDVIEPSARDRLREAVETALQGGEPFEVTYPIRTAGGQRRWMWERGRVVDHEDGVEILEGVITDITEKRERRRELEQYRTIVETVGDPVYALDETGAFTLVNDAMASLTGYDRGELVGEHVSAVMAADDLDRGQELVVDLLRSDRDAGTFEMDLVTADGERIPCETHVAILPVEDGEFRGSVGVLRDISERKERERQLEEFASVVSHDLRSPLNVVQGRVDIMRETGELRHLDDVAAAVDRMEQLIDDVLELAREGQHVGEREAVPLDVVARRAWEQVRTPEATLEVTTDATVRADFERLQALLENLFRNAVEHGSTGPASPTRRDGDAHDSTDPATPARHDAVEDGAANPHSQTGRVGGTADLTVAVVETDGGFAVADDGEGIPERQRPHVFERGFTTSDDGTGFGLSIVESVVSAHGWTISVTESEAGGARFEIRT